MKRYLIVILAFISFYTAAAQPLKIAVFSPLYLDSAFDISGKPRFDKTFPKYLTPGLEFYYGVQTALDSLQKRGAPLEVFVYDTKSKQPFSGQLLKPELDSVSLMIGHTNASETKVLAEAALQKKAPFISVSYPNDAGVVNNPYFVVLNSTLQTHVEGIYNYLQKNHSRDRVVVFRRPGVQEDQIRNYLNEYAKSTVSTQLNIKFVDLGMDISARTLTPHLDSLRKTVCIAGSLDEAFATKLTQALAGLNKTYPVTVVGMPTWDNFNFSKVGELEIVYTAPFYYNRSNFLENNLGDDYAKRMSIKPGDMFFRGYETTLRFALLLLDTRRDLASNLTRKGNTVLTLFDIQPVFKDKSDMTLDYFENKHLYFVRVFGGAKNIINVMRGF